MLFETLQLALGILLLIGGGEVLVRGATGLARGLGVSPLAIGLTVVAFGTSAPELAVNVTAALQDRGGISFGNIIGSNMANIGLIVGCTALIRPIPVRRSFVTRELPMMLFATAAVVFYGFDEFLGRGPDLYSRGEGLALLILFVLFLLYTVGDFVRQRRDSLDPAAAAAEATASGAAGSISHDLALTAAGLAALLGGAQLSVAAAVVLARALGVPEHIIALTVLAVGTSLPELVASVVATLRGHVELGIGNIVGSNIFNLLLVMATAASIRPFAVPTGGHLDLVIMTLLSVLLLVVSMSANRRIIRTEAVTLLLIYGSYLCWRSAEGRW